MTTPPIPPAMREAVADKLGDYLIYEGAGSDQLADPYDVADVLLAAVLGVCEVREEPGMRQVNAERPELSGDLWADDCPSRRYFEEAANSWADMEAAGDAGPWSHSLLRRLHFTAPAEQVDTEGAPA